MAQTNHWLIDSVLFKKFNEDVFKMCLLKNFDYSRQMGISHLLYNEISIITRNILCLEGINILLRDMKSAVLNVLVYKASM